MKTAMITGINGQDGSYLAEFLLKKGYFIVGLNKKSSSTKNIHHLLTDNNLKLMCCDLSKKSTLNSLLLKYKPNEFYNLGGLSDVPTSFLNPEHTFDTVGNGVLRILSAIKNVSPTTKFFQASSAEMYGKSDDCGPLGYTEDSKMVPTSPYALAKLYAHHMVKIYRESYGIHASSGILFNHESPRRKDIFVTKKITKAAAKIKLGLQTKLKLGNLESRIDWGFAGDYVEAMWLILQQQWGDEYVIATSKTHTIKQFLETVFEYAGLGNYKKYVEHDSSYTSNKNFYRLGDSSKIKKITGWNPKINMENLAKMMYEHDLFELKTT